MHKLQKAIIAAAFLAVGGAIPSISQASIVDVVNSTSATTTYSSGYTTPVLARKSATITSINQTATMSDGTSDGYTEYLYIPNGSWSLSATSGNSTTAGSDSFANDTAATVIGSVPSSDLIKAFFSYNLSSSTVFQVDAAGPYLVTAAYAYAQPGNSDNLGSYSLLDNSTTVVSGSYDSLFGNTTGSTGYAGTLMLYPGQTYTLTVNESGGDETDNLEIAGTYNSSAVDSVTGVPEPATAAGALLAISMLRSRGRR